MGWVGRKDSLEVFKPLNPLIVLYKFLQKNKAEQHYTIKNINFSIMQNIYFKIPIVIKNYI